MEPAVRRRATPRRCPRHRPGHGGMYCVAGRRPLDGRRADDQHGSPAVRRHRSHADDGRRLSPAADRPIKPTNMTKLRCRRRSALPSPRAICSRCASSSAMAATSSRPSRARAPISASSASSEDGTIKVPVVGTVQVAGLDLNQIERKIIQQLGTQVQEPEVIVEFDAPRTHTVMVSGDVKNPGRVSMLEDVRTRRRRHQQGAARQIASPDRLGQPAPGRGAA